MDIEKILSQLTLEEKASLLSGADFWHTKAVDRLGLPRVMVSDGPHGLRKQDEKGDHLGLLDAIKAVCFPAASAMAASFDPAVPRAIGEAMGDACQHENVGVILGPAVNIKRSPLCGRNFEYFSEDPFLAGELSAALVDGVQSRGVGTSLKHYAANSQEHRRMSGSSEVDERTLREIYFPAFETTVKRTQPWTVMCSYNQVNGVFASENRWLLTDVLRDEWGFKGLVMSDWGAVSDRVKGVAAGLDLEMPSSGGANDRRIVEAVRAGRLSEEEVDICVRRVLAMVQQITENAKPGTPWDMEAQHALAREMSAECMVLLKNENRVLPFAAGEKVAVIGEFARAPRYQGGGSSHINSFRVESLMDALEGCSDVTYAQGYRTDADVTDEQLIAEAVEAARRADKAVIVAGLPDSFESEGYDRTDMRMPTCQNELIRRVAEANPNTAVVLYNGSPVEMPWADDVAAIVEAYLGGQAVGGATRAILWGEKNPSGRLPESFPYRNEHNPSYLTYGGEGDVAVYNEGVFVGYRYYDRKAIDVRFPFGHGLSYTTFSYSNLKLNRSEITDQDTLQVCVDVTNTGDRAGKEAVQLYVRNAPATVFRPIRELKGLCKVELAPGETKTVTFTLDQRAFAYWNTALHGWLAESGVYGIEIGINCHDIALSADVKLTCTATLPLRPVTPDTIMMDIVCRPGAVQVLRPMLEALLKVFPPDGGTPKEVTDEVLVKAVMDSAFARYLPLRGLVSFGGGAITFDQLQQMCDAVNNG